MANCVHLPKKKVYICGGGADMETFYVGTRLPIPEELELPEEIEL